MVREMTTSLDVQRQERPPHRVRVWLLFLLTFTIPLRDQSLLSIPGANVRVGDVFILLGLLLMAWDIAARRSSLPVGVVELLVITFVVYALGSLVWSLDPLFGAARVGKLVRDLVFYLVLVIELRKDFAVAFRALANGAVASFGYLLVYLLYALAYGKVNVARIAAAQIADSGTVGSWRDEALGATTFGGGTINALGMWSAVALVLWIGAATADGRNTKPVRFWLVTFSLMTMTLATLSRGVWLGLAVAILLWVVLMRGRLRINRIAVVLGLVGVVAFGGAISATPVARIIAARVRSAVTPSKDGAITERFRLWAAARELVRQNPVLGVGAGGTIVGVPRVSRYQKSFVHNLYLQLSAEFGLLGMLLWTVLIACSLGRAAIARSTLSAGDRRTLYRMASALVVLLVLCLSIGLTGLDFSELEWWIALAMATTIPIAAGGRGQRDIGTLA